MRPLRSASGILLLLALLFSVSVNGRNVAEQREIDYLIESIAVLQEAHFVRNGDEFDAPHAADHLRVKLRRAGDKITTAEDFIAYCATGSSVTGQKYLIRFADGRRIDAAVFLRERLAAYRARKPHGG